jgi:peptidoglycan/LPS O-acetylase OafA/YrhL
MEISAFVRRNVVPGSSTLDSPMTGAAVVPEGRVFHTLDALRGTAAIGVMVFHMGPIFTPIATPGGYLAVDLFFMMSGVVLSHAYEARFRAGMGTLDFMRARLIRLYPLYLAGALFGIVVALASLRGRNSQNWDPSSLSQAVALALFFLPNFSARPVNEIFPLNIPCWSLFFEILVNLLFVVFWPLLTSCRLIVVSLLTGAVVGVAIAHTGSIDQGSTGMTFGVGLARTIFGFSVGVLIARHIPRAHRGQNNLGVLTIVAVVSIGIAGRPQQEFRALWDAICVLLVFPLMVYFGTLIDPGSRLRRIATFLGVTSYAIYVLHSPLSSVLNSATRYFAVGTGAPYMGVGVLAFLLAGCWLIDRYIDMPIRRQLSRIIPKMQASRAE